MPVSTYGFATYWPDSPGLPPWLLAELSRARTAAAPAALVGYRVLSGTAGADEIHRHRPDDFVRVLGRVLAAGGLPTTSRIDLFAVVPQTMYVAPERPRGPLPPRPPALREDGVGLAAALGSFSREAGRSLEWAGLPPTAPVTSWGGFPILHLGIA